MGLPEEFLRLVAAAESSFEQPLARAVLIVALDRARGRHDTRRAQVEEPGA